MSRKQFPKYSELPIKSGFPQGSAWGVFDNGGVKDVLGTLNFITKETILEAKEEIRVGQSINLNLPLHLPFNACPGRPALEVNTIAKAHGMFCAEEEIHLNTQSSSQWDGLLHYANQSFQQYYNGIDYKKAIDTKQDLTLGIQVIAENGGIVGRGVLLDYVRYASKKGISYDPLTNHAISLAEIKDMIHDEKIEIRRGDVLLIRAGLSKWIRDSTPESIGPFAIASHMGVDPTPDLLAWIWDQNLAAVGGDAIAFEACPAPDGSFMRLHEACLPGWGMPIGELLDLEQLAEVCEAQQRWTFFITVCPLNIHGGAGTVANTLAIL
ncbi:hypothetical protein KCU64_g251, partial [Aureobasidium melanogenum]